MTNDTDVPRKLERLVLDAFKLAARDGKPEWYRMRSSVLKNRMLDLTDRAFHENDYGADRFMDLVESLHTMLKPDYSIMPYSVELLEPFRSGVRSEFLASPKTQIRSDLWHAIVDYSRDITWLWDPESGQAVGVRALDDDRSADVLPTVDRSTLQHWREKFAREHGTVLPEHEARQLAEWASEGLGTGALPAQLRGLWNAAMRKCVHERLLGFFQAHDYEAPPDLLVVQTKGQKRESELQAFVVRCVSLMSDHELRQLPIPAEIAMRAQR